MVTRIEHICWQIIKEFATLCHIPGHIKIEFHCMFQLVKFKNIPSFISTCPLPIIPIRACELGLVVADLSV